MSGRRQNSQATPLYNQPAGLVERVGEYFPMAALGATLLDDLFAPSITKMLGSRLMDLPDPMRRPSTSIFAAADLSVAGGYSSRLQMGAGISGGTALGDMATAAYRRFIEQQALMDSAMDASLRRVGAGYSFVASGIGGDRSLSQAYGGTTSADDIVSMFSTLGFEKGLLSQGERGVLLDRMAKTGSAVGFAAAQGTAGVTGNFPKADELRSEVRGLEQALAEWKDVLDQDVKKALESLTTLFGGDVVSMFKGSSSELRDMALGIKHANALSGVSTAEYVSNVEKATKMIGVYGGPRDTAMAVSAAIGLTGTELGGYRRTDQEMVKLSTEIATQGVSSTAAAYYTGGYQKWRSEAGRDMEEPAARAAYQKLWADNLGGRAVTLETANDILGYKLGENDYIRASKGEWARDFGIVAADEITAMATEETVKSFQTKFLEYSDDAKFLASQLGDTNTFFNIMEKSPAERQKELVAALTAKGVDVDDEMRTRISRFVGSANLQAQDVLNRNFSYLSSVTGYNIFGLSPSKLEVARGKRQEAAKRAEIEARLNLSGLSRAASFSRLLKEEDVELGMIPKLLFGIDDLEKLPISLQATDEKSRAAMVQALEGFAEVTRTYDIDGDALLASLGADVQSGTTTQREQALKTINELLGLRPGKTDADGRGSFTYKDPKLTKDRLEAIQKTYSVEGKSEALINKYSGAAFNHALSYKVGEESATIKGKKISELPMAVKDRLAILDTLDRGIASENPLASKLADFRNELLKSDVSNTDITDRARQFFSTSKELSDIHQRSQETMGVTSDALGMSKMIDMFMQAVTSAGGILTRNNNGN